ncbi:MAG TPA: tetratricopeptide repeat protein [Polyangiaceae bacterium]|nr:tetratricopeptide repeat protein [Polyangiaceae bacterium]
MSQPEYTDLVCKAHRQELNPDEERRLDELLQTSLEVRLMDHMLSEFERESRMCPGDDMLLARIQERVLGAPTSARPPARARRLTMVLLPAAVLLVSTLAGAGMWLGSGRFTQLTAIWSSNSATKSAPAAPTVHKSRVAHPKPASTPSTPAAPAAPDSAAPPVEPLGEPLPTVTGSTGASTQSVHAPTGELRMNIPNPSSELFARANLLRREGRGADAADLYRQLLERYPRSREAGPARLALAKYLHAKDPARALIEYRALASSGGALRAEALWGISESAERVGERALADRALNDLVREFPDSPYAEVARARISHGTP